MQQGKTPTSSLSAFRLLVTRVLRQGLTLFRRTCAGNKSPETPPAQSSHFTRHPLDVIKNIVAHLAYDLPSLRACSLTCHTWYTAAAPHLHHRLIIDTRSWFDGCQRIRCMHSRGLLPLVGYVKIRGCYYGDGIKLSGCCFPRQSFETLTNVNELTLTYLDIPSFLPRIRKCFGHFLPTVRSLRLGSPKGYDRQIIFFIGSFQHLQDLELFRMKFDPWYNTGPEDKQIPPFSPPLQGRLTTRSWMKQNFFKDMAQLFGGIRFTEMNIFDTYETRFLLRACAKTLRILQCAPNDPLVDRFIRVFDLSRNTSLRGLHITAADLDAASLSGNGSKFLKYVLSTVRPSAFIQVLVIYATSNFRGVDTRKNTQWPHLWEWSLSMEEEDETQEHRRRLWFLREAHNVRNFELVLCANVWGPVEEYAVRRLKEVVVAAEAESVFDHHFPAPRVTSDPRRDLYTRI